MTTVSSRLFRAARIIGGTATFGSIATISTYLLTTRKTNIVTLPTNYVDKSPVFAALNPRSNPVTSDIATRRIKIQDLPIDLQDHIRNGSGAELTRRFCAGIWAGSALNVQRKVMTDKYRSLPGREDHLWTTNQMLDSDYTIGTKIVDHFEVVESNSHEITVRCGDTPLNQAVRPSDGLFRMTTRFLPETEEVEFGLTSIFWNGTMELMDNGKPHDSGPMPSHIGMYIALKRA